LLLLVKNVAAWFAISLSCMSISSGHSIAAIDLQRTYNRNVLEE
jgi:hypothetical protein